VILLHIGHSIYITNVQCSCVISIHGRRLAACTSLFTWVNIFFPSRSFNLQQWSNWLTWQVGLMAGVKGPIYSPFGWLQSKERREMGNNRRYACNVGYFCKFNTGNISIFSELRVCYFVCIAILLPLCFALSCLLLCLHCHPSFLCVSDCHTLILFIVLWLCCSTKINAIQEVHLM
jgi:hypothetical protein